jgi:sterol desaturase/sphingolipid hydroxylase (fatty acid hydroxylase superfamily)
VVAAFHGLFQHWNVHTPVWMGYFIQRPESHCEHHRRGVHCAELRRLPALGLLFGSFRNPRRFEGDCGFDAPADRRSARCWLGGREPRAYGAAASA